MKQTKAHIYLHFVWGTWQRLPLVTSDIERATYRCIEKEASRLKSVVLALGGMPDHVHLVVKIPTVMSAAELMQQAKGVSSAFVRDQLRPGELFRWQEGYGVFSISPDDVERVIAYVENQKQHHAAATVEEEWEETEEEYMPQP